jgi:hypothetical protein
MRYYGANATRHLTGISYVSAFNGDDHAQTKDLTPDRQSRPWNGFIWSQAGSCRTTGRRPRTGREDASHRRLHQDAGPVKRRKANGWSKRGTLYRRALDVLRTAEQPLTATDIAWKMLEAADRKDASKTDAQVVALGILRSLLSHNGKGVLNVAEGKPAAWKLAS